MIIGHLSSDTIDAWKEEKIDAHRRSGHTYVIFAHRMDESGSFTYTVKAGGYTMFPEWKLSAENVEIYSIEEDCYIEQEVYE